MKLTILQMQALEFSIRNLSLGLTPIYRNDAGDILQGEFFNGAGDTIKFTQLANNSFRPKINLFTLANMPRLFSGWKSSIADSSRYYTSPFDAFADVKKLLDQFKLDYQNPAVFGFNEDIGTFDPLPILFKCRLNNIQFPFIELLQDSYDLISLVKTENQTA